MDERATFEQDKTNIHSWVQTYPLVRKGDWYKIFGSLILAGEGSFAKTALKSHWTPRQGAQNLDSFYPPPADTQKWYYGYVRFNAAEPWKPQPRPQAMQPSKPGVVRPPLKSSKLLMTAAEQQQFGFAPEYTRPETPADKGIDWDQSAKDLLEEWENDPDAVEEIIKHFKGKHAFQYPGGDVYMVQGNVVTWDDKGSIWVYGDPMEFVATCDVDQYAPDDMEERFNKKFWEECPTLYHASPEENIESILASGIGTANKTRGMTNRGVGASVFATTNEDYLEDGSYGDAIFEIDTSAMAKDGYTPFVSREPDQVEGDLRSALARRLGLDDRYNYNYEQGVDCDTVIVSGGIPAKYLKLISGQETGKTASKTAVVKIPKVLEPLVAEAKNYPTFQEFLNAVTQSDLTDLSNYALHRWGRAIPRDAKEAGDTIKDSVAAIESSNPAYMEDLRSEPDVLGAIKNNSRSITIYRAVPPTTAQILDFFDDEKRKWQRLGTRGEYPFREKMKRFFPEINDSRSGYYNWLSDEEEKIKAGTSRFKGVDDPSIKIGDFVTLNRSYAKEHGESTLVGQQGYPTFKIVSKRVPKTDVIWNGDDWKEWAYSPQTVHTLTLQDIYAAAHVGKVAAETPVTETPAFKAWFQGSKCVDAQGKPLRVYHGTVRDFEEFNPPSGDDLGIFTADSPVASDSYAAGEGGRILPLYLKITHPYEADHDWRQSVQGYVWGQTGFDSIVEFIDSLKQKGYDGIHILRDDSGNPSEPEERNHDLWIAFSPNQVKSAIGNSTFDPSNNRITAKLARMKKEAEAKPLSISDIQAIIREYMPILTPGLPIPELKVVNNTGSTWNGRDTWRGSKPDNTHIDIQKACTYDETTVRRIIAHELCHHDVFLTVYRYLSPTERKFIHDGHGKEWQAVAKKFNDRFGADFVTKVSDQNIVVADTGKPYLLLVADLKGNGDLWFCYCSRPSNKQQRFINTKLEQGARLFKVTDPEWSRRGSPVGDAWGGLRKGKDDASIAKLKKLWDEGEQLPPFKVVESQKEREQREIMEKWRQYEADKKKREAERNLPPLTPEEQNMSDDELLAELTQ